MATDKTYTYLKTQTGITFSVSNGKLIDIGTNYYKTGSTLNTSILGTILIDCQENASITVKASIGNYVGSTTLLHSGSTTESIAYSGLKWTGNTPTYGDITGITISVSGTSNGFSATTSYTNTVQTVSGERMLPVVYGISIQKSGSMGSLTISARTATTNQSFSSRTSTNVAFSGATIIMEPASGSTGSGWVAFPDEIFEDIKKDWTLSGITTGSSGTLIFKYNDVAAMLYKITATYNGAYLYSSTACTTPMDGRSGAGFLARTTNASHRTYYKKSTVSAKTHTIYLMFADETDMYSVQRQLTNDKLPVPSTLNTFYNEFDQSQIRTTVGFSVGIYNASALTPSSAYTTTNTGTCAGYVYRYVPKDQLIGQLAGIYSGASIGVSNGFFGAVVLYNIPNTISKATFRCSCSINDSATTYDSSGLKINDVFTTDCANAQLYDYSLTGETSSVYIYAIPIKYKDAMFQKCATYEDLGRRAMCLLSEKTSTAAPGGGSDTYRFANRTTRYLSQLSTNFDTLNSDIFDVIDSSGNTSLVPSYHEIDDECVSNKSNDISSALTKSMEWTGAKAALQSDYPETFRLSNDMYLSEMLPNLMRRTNTDYSVTAPTIGFSVSYDEENDNMDYTINWTAGTNPITSIVLQAGYNTSSPYGNMVTINTTFNNCYAGTQSGSQGASGSWEGGTDNRLYVKTSDNIEYIYNNEEQLIGTPSITLSVEDQESITCDVLYSYHVYSNAATLYNVETYYKKSSDSDWTTLYKHSISSAGTTNDVTRTNQGFTVGEAGDYDFKTVVTYGNGKVLTSSIVSVAVTKGCCFRAGTQVLLNESGDTKNIEDIKIGDHVISYNVDTKEFYQTVVKNVFTRKDTVKMAIVETENFCWIDMTQYHPILTTDGWHSITNYHKMDTLQLGDTVITKDGESKVIDIHLYDSDPITTYNLDVVDEGEDPDVDNNDNFIANGMVVHNAC